MASETRILPTFAPRSTGIERMTTSVARTVATTSHVTASPSAGHAAHAQARAAAKPGVQVLAQVPVRAGGKAPTVTAVVLAPKVPTEAALTIDQRALVTYLLEQFCGDASQPAADLELGRAAIARVAAMADDAAAYTMTPAPPAGVPQTIDELTARLVADGMTEAQAQAIATAPGSPFAAAAEPSA